VLIVMIGCLQSSWLEQWVISSVIRLLPSSQMSQRCSAKDHLLRRCTTFVGRNQGSLTTEKTRSRCNMPSPDITRSSILASQHQTFQPPCVSIGFSTSWRLPLSHSLCLLSTSTLRGTLTSSWPTSIMPTAPNMLDDILISGQMFGLDHFPRLSDYMTTHQRRQSRGYAIIICVRYYLSRLEGWIAYSICPASRYLPPYHYHRTVSVFNTPTAAVLSQAKRSARNFPAS